MFTKTLTVAALAAAASAQGMNLTAALAGFPQLSNLTSYLGLVPGLAEQLSSAQDVTLLAPNNAAFAKALNASGSSGSIDTSMIQALFQYHVLNGTYYASNVTSNATFIPTALTSASNATLLNPASVEAIRTDGQVKFISGLLTESTVTSANNNFTGGTIHIIDTVLTVPQNISATAVTLNETAFAGAARFAGFPAAIGPLPSNLTAFVPNNAAFQAISNLVANLSMADLGGILAYHIVPNVTAYSTDLRNETLPTLSGGNITISIIGADVFVDAAKVVVPNILVQEGVVHIIDAVLNPKNSTATPSMSQTAGVPGFASATSGSDVPFTSGIPTPTSVPAGATGGGAAASASASGSGSESSSSSSGGAAMPMITGAVGAAALFGGAAAVLNL